MQKTTRIALLAAAALALPAAASAQQTQPAPTPPAPAAPAQDEAAQIQQRLGALQQRALQDPAVKAESEAFEAYLLSAMTRLDATMPEKKARADALKAEVDAARAARAASDNAKLNQLAVEAQGLQQFFAGLNQRAMAQADVQERRQAFVGRLFAKMNELDPQAQAMVDRLTALRTGGAAPAPAQR